MTFMVVLVAGMLAIFLLGKIFEGIGVHGFFLHAWFIPYARLESLTLNRSFFPKRY